MEDSETGGLTASDPGRISFENYLRVNHLTEQTYPTDSRVLQGYVNV